MFVKVVKPDGRVNGPFECRHVSRSYFADRIEYELSDADGRISKVLSIPQDGNRIYFENDRGDTTDSDKWPPDPNIVWPPEQ